MEEELAREEQQPAGEGESESADGEQARCKVVTEAQPQETDRNAAEREHREPHALCGLVRGVELVAPVGVHLHHVKGEHSRRLLVSDGVDAVELAEEVVFDPVHTNLRTEHDGSARDEQGKPVRVAGLLHEDEDEEDEQVEALHDVGAGDLEHADWVELLEHGALELGEVVGDEQSRKRVGVGVEGDR